MELQRYGQMDVVYYGFCEYQQTNFISRQEDTKVMAVTLSDLNV